MYRQFNIQQFYVLPTQCIYVFVWISEQTAIISLYNINWLVFVTETTCGVSHFLEYDVASLGIWFPTFRDYIFVLSRRIKTSKNVHCVLGLPALEDETIALSLNVAGQKPTEASSYSSGMDTASSPQRNWLYELNISVRQVSATVMKQPRWCQRLCRYCSLAFCRYNLYLDGCLQQKLCARYSVAVWRHGLSPGLWWWWWWWW